MYRLLYDFPCMRTSDPTIQLSPGTAVRSLLGAFVDSAVTGNSKLVTAWPRSVDAPAALHQMGVLWHVVGEDDEEQTGVRAGDLTSLATLTWPFTNETMRKLGGVLAYRRIIQPRNGLHINRAEQRCYSYHIQLRRLGDLNPDMEIKRSGRLSTLRDHDELQHPSLAELAPIVVMDRDGAPLLGDCRERFLGRIRKYTLIRGDLTPDELFDISGTPFILFGIAPDTDMKNATRVIQVRRPDVILLDLHGAAKIHGDQWPAKACELLRWVRIYSSIPEERQSEERAAPPVFAIADTPWLAHRFAKEVMPSYAKATRLSELVILNIASDLLSQGVQAAFASRISTVVVTCVARHLTPFLIEADSLQKSLEPLDRRMSELVREMMHFARRMICLPGGMDAYDRFVGQRGEKYFGPVGPLAMVSELLELERQGRAGKESGRVKEYVQMFQEAIAGLKETTPGNEFLRRLRTGEAFTKRGNTLLVLPDRTTESFSRWVLGTGELPPGDLETTDGKHGIDSFLPVMHRYQKAYLLLPRWDTMARLLASHEAPEVVHLVCDEATATSIRGQAAFLRGRVGFQLVHERLDKLLHALDEALDGVPVPIPIINEVRLTPSAVPAYEGDGQSLVLGFADGRAVSMFEGSSVVLYRHEAEPRPFICCQASRLSPGDMIFLVDDDYLALAERHYLGKCEANVLLDPYHRQILALREKIPGEGMREKARCVRLLMAEGSLKSIPDENTVMTWLDVERLIGAPLDKVRPHAPHSEEWFLAFTGAIGMLSSQSALLWKFGIFDTRSRRISAGFSISRFCTALLTDPDSIMAFFGGDNEDLSHLERCARNELTEIFSITKVETRGEKYDH